MMRKLQVAIVVAALLVIAPAKMADADDSDPCQASALQCSPTQAGLDTSSTKEQWANQPKFPGDNGKSPIQAANGPRYEYSSTTACTLGEPGSPGSEALCTMAITNCADPTKGSGPLTRIWRRLVQDGQPPSAWQSVGVTCYPDVAPGSRPTVNMAMIQQAFNLTPWSVPQITTQPAGNVTLIGLDTYYKVNWTQAGYQPGEVDAIDAALMNGYQVDVRVKLDHFTWQFGDGQSFGPTSSEGGVYPSGNITHKYRQSGAFPASVNTTFAGEFRINGGDWAPIPDTVTVPGPGTAVTVRTAAAQLVDH